MGTGQVDPMNLDYRVRQLEDWKKMVEQDGIAKTLAVMDERQSVMARVMDAKAKADAERDKRVDERLDSLEKTRDERSGFSGGIRTWVVVGLGTLLLAGGFVLQLLAYAGSQ